MNESPKVIEFPELRDHIGDLRGDDDSNEGEPGTVAVALRPCLVFLGGVGRGMSRIGGDERGLLDDVAFDGETLCVKLPLELPSDRSILPGLSQRSLNSQTVDRSGMVSGYPKMV